MPQMHPFAEYSPDYAKALERWEQLTERLFPTEREVLDLDALTELSVAFRWLWSVRFGVPARVINEAIETYTRAATLSLIN